MKLRKQDGKSAAKQSGINSSAPFHASPYPYPVTRAFACPAELMPCHAMPSQPAREIKKANNRPRTQSDHERPV